MATRDNDSRLFGQRLPAPGSVFTLSRYEQPPPKFSDHHHCSFCFRRIAAAEAGHNDSVEFGYTTPNETDWICTTCFDDFKDQFEWKVVSENYLFHDLVYKYQNSPS